MSGKGGGGASQHPRLTPTGAEELACIAKPAEPFHRSSCAVQVTLQGQSAQEELSQAALWTLEQPDQADVRADSADTCGTHTAPVTSSRGKPKLRLEAAAEQRAPGALAGRARPEPYCNARVLLQRDHEELTLQLDKRECTYRLGVVGESRGFSARAHVQRVQALAAVHSKSNVCAERGKETQRLKLSELWEGAHRLKSQSFCCCSHMRGS